MIGHEPALRDFLGNGIGFGIRLPVAVAGRPRLRTKVRGNKPFRKAFCESFEDRFRLLLGQGFEVVRKNFAGERDFGRLFSVRE
ncbi:hypothetical protein ML401_39020 (plasmid) [Bradyrhizobium sp. 62B]|nr:hypothetical protein ML401_39020 [Bradyrhizobium sp. 62B]